MKIRSIDTFHNLRVAASVVLVAGTTLGVFLVDLITPRGMAVWLLYVVPLVVASRLFRGLYIYAFASLLIVLLFIGMVGSAEHSEGGFSLFNRTLAVVVFLFTASILSARREAEEELERLNEQLEQRVEERTEALQTANQELIAHIEQRQRAEREIRKRDVQLVAAQRMAHIGSWEWDLVTDTYSWSDEMYRIQDLQRNGVSPSFDLFLAAVHPDDRDTVREAIEQAIRDRKPFSIDHRIVLPDGAVRTLHGEGSVVTDAAGNPVRLTGTGQDITERKRIEDALVRSRDYYVRLLDEFPNPIWRARVDGACDYFNKSWLRFTGRTLEQEFGEGWLEGVHPDDRARCKARFDEAVNRRDHFVMEYRLRYHDGIYHWVVDHGMPLYGLEGEFAGFIGSCFDNEEQRRSRNLVEEQAQALKRSNADLEQFAYVASHDLQEPLRMVGGFLQLIDKRYRASFDDEGRQFIAFAVDGSRRMQEMINDLLTFARLGRSAKVFRPVNCNKALSQALEHLAASIKESGASIHHDVLPVVMGDDTQLTQVFQNLVSNAIKFRGERAPEVRITVERKENVWVINVKDNGIGIDPQQSQKIFTLFHRLHGRGEYPGTGLGLAITKKIVEAHGGRIGVDSTPGQGSTFWLSLPVIDHSREHEA